MRKTLMIGCCAVVFNVVVPAVADDDALYSCSAHLSKDAYADAFPFCKKAAEQGYASAQNNLGWMYDHGRGVAQDYKQAVRWFKKNRRTGACIRTIQTWRAV